VDRGIEGEEMREEAWCTGANERKRAKRGTGGGPVARQRGKGAGVRGSAPRGGKIEDERGGIRHGRRHCRVTGEGAGHERH
jgi:hypothetical protein